MAGAGKERVLSGMRPSGKVHLGNYLGALANWVTLQVELDCYYFVADWHALTDDLDTSDVPANAVEMVADWLGAGLDPERSTLFIQSLVPEHAELHLIFSMTTPVTWLERVPTYRERIEQPAPWTGRVAGGGFRRHGRGRDPPGLAPPGVGGGGARMVIHGGAEQ